MMFEIVEHFSRIYEMFKRKISMNVQVLEIISGYVISQKSKNNIFIAIRIIINFVCKNVPHFSPNMQRYLATYKQR